MDFTTRAVTEREAEAASAVVHASFVQLASQDWGTQAQQLFLTDALPERLGEKIKVSAYAAGAFVDGHMVGFLLMPEPSVLSMLFVHPKWLRRGIAKTLWESARTRIEVAFPTVRTVELNTTPYALEFYRTVGFVPISTEFERRGARATRMACWLPARALGAECARTPLTTDPTRD